MHGLTNPDQGVLKGVVAGKVISVERANGTTASPDQIYLDERLIVDLTNHVQNGTLTWSAPPGNGTWRLFAFWGGFTNQISCDNGGDGTTPIEKGSLVVDHFSKEGAEVHTSFFEKHVLNDNIRANLKLNGKYAWEDSMELLFVIPWTQGFLERFHSQHGYDLVKYLPLLFNKDNSFTASPAPYTEEYHYGSYTEDGLSIHNVHFRQTLSECYQDYIQYHVQWTRSLGIEFSLQPSYNLPLSFLNEVPVVDALEGEPLGFPNIDAYRCLSGPAQLAGRSDISSECGAVFQPAFSQTIPELLKLAKRAYAGGLATMVFHGMAYSGPYAKTSWPGYQPFGYRTTDSWNRIQPAWKHMEDIVGYVGRTQHVLKTGIPQVDLAMYHADSRWEASVIYESDNLRRKGFTYNFIGPGNLHLPGAHVSQRVLAPDGPSYKALIFLDRAQINYDTLSKVKEYDQAGLPIFFVGAPQIIPISSSRESSNNLSTLENIIEQGKNIYHLETIEQLPHMLAQTNLAPRVSFAGSTSSVYPVHRLDPGTGRAYVWLFNDGNTTASFIADFHIAKGMVPFLLDAWTRMIAPVAKYKMANTGIQIPFTLDPDETAIVGFEPARANRIPWVTSTTGAVDEVKYTSEDHLVVHTKGRCSATLNNRTKHHYNVTLPDPSHLTRWNIEIEDWYGNPNNTVSVETLTRTHAFSNQPLLPWQDLSRRLENVSGIDIYTTNFTAPDVKKLGAYLSLGPVFNTMRVWVNDERLPSPPTNDTRIDISDYMYRGQVNSVRVEVTTTLYNRLRTEADKMLTMGYPVSVIAPTYSNEERQAYGLLGPVAVDWIIKERALWI